MRFRSSGGYEPNDGIPHRVGDEKHSAVYHFYGVEAQLVGGIEIVELHHERVQEHPRGGSEADTMLLPVGPFLGVVPFEVHRQPRLRIY
jgi:hypothetical protein